MSPGQSSAERDTTQAGPARERATESSGGGAGAGMMEGDFSAFALSPMAIGMGGLQTRQAYGGLDGILQKSTANLGNRTSSRDALQLELKSGRSIGEGKVGSSLTAPKGIQLSSLKAVQLDDKALAGDGGTGAKASAEVKADEAPDFLGKAQKLPDWDTLLKRMDSLFPDADKTPLINASAKYVVTMQVENAAASTAAANEVTAELQKLKAFKTNKDGGHFWSGVKGAAAEAASKQGTEDAANEAPSATANAPAPAANAKANDDTTKKGIGKVLETTDAGSLFDGLGFGTTKENWRAQLGPLWNELSRNYAQGVRGTVHVHQYVGVNTENIFSTVEWPALQELIKSGKVKDMTFYIYYNCGPKPANGTPNRKLHHVLANQTDLSNLVKFPLRGEPNGGYPPGVNQGAEW